MTRDRGSLAVFILVASIAALIPCEFQPCLVHTYSVELFNLINFIFVLKSPPRDRSYWMRKCPATFSVRITAGSIWEQTTTDTGEGAIDILRMYFTLISILQFVIKLLSFSRDKDTKLNYNCKREE